MTARMARIARKTAYPDRNPGGFMMRGGFSGLSLTPEAQLTVQDSPEFIRIMEEYYAQFPYMRADMEKKENILSGNSCAAIDLAEEQARAKDWHEQSMDERP